MPSSLPTSPHLIQAERKAVAEIKVIDEPVTVVVSEKAWVRVQNGWSRRARREQLQLQARGQPVRALSAAVSIPCWPWQSRPCLQCACGRLARGGDGQPMSSLD